MIVCLECRISNQAEAGGVAQIMIGMAHGLSLLAGNDRYIFIVNPTVASWLEKYIAGPCELRVVPAHRWGTRRDKARRFLTKFGFGLLLRFWDDVRSRLPEQLPPSDGVAEQCGAQIVHFLHQWGYRTAIPSIYHPHDLQHIHLPEFFSPRQRAHRSATYKALCEQAQMVAVTSTWTAQDVHRQLHIAAEKIAVVPFAPPTTAYGVPSHDAIKRARDLIGFERFILYPAHTWPHKNHLALLEALAILRDGGSVVPLVCSGGQSEFFDVIRRAISRLKLDGQIRFVGFVDEEMMRALYSLCTFVVVPTKFEAASGPVWDAFAMSKTVAASNVTSLPEQVGDAGLLFDPGDVRGMSRCVKKLWTDDVLRQDLAARGKQKVSNFSWEKTASRFYAHYRRILGLPLTPEDRSAIDAPTLI